LEAALGFVGESALDKTVIEEPFDLLVELARDRLVTDTLGEGNLSKFIVLQQCEDFGGKL